MTEVSASNLWMARALREVPVVCAALGPVAGGPAARLVTSHLSIMTRKTSQVLIGGPALVERATREKLTKEELGGPDVHLRSVTIGRRNADEAEVTGGLDVGQRVVIHPPDTLTHGARVIERQGF